MLIASGRQLREAYCPTGNQRVTNCSGAMALGLPIQQEDHMAVEIQDGRCCKCSTMPTSIAFDRDVLRFEVVTTSNLR